MSIPVLPTRTALPFATALLSFVLVAVLTSTAHASVTYSYDAHHRLASATYDDGTSERYSYDDTGNRLASASSPATSRVFENAEDGDTLGWDIYDNDPAGATIANVYDTDRASRVIEFTGSGMDNAYQLGNANGSAWNETGFTVLEWSMRFSQPFTVCVEVWTAKGPRQLCYTAEDEDRLGAGSEIHHGLGAHLRDGRWHVVVRDLAYDLRQAQPDNTLQAVDGFIVRGGGRLDDVKAKREIPADLDTDGDGLTDVLEIFTYGTNPYYVDTDGDEIDDKVELDYWGANWSADPDGDGLINLLDPDADNDGFRDGVELKQGTDPANASSAPASIVYEDAEDGEITGWDVQDSDPAGATITNVYDNDLASRVIELNGSGMDNAYRLRGEAGLDWYDANFKTLSWRMHYDEVFTVSITVLTKDGERTLAYTPEDVNRLGAGNTIHHGLGAATIDGAWHTLTRDLAQDLKEAQPNNELQAVLNFSIQGSGRLDEIKTK